MGLGLSMKMGDWCETVVDLKNSWKHFKNDFGMAKKEWEWAKADNHDCNSVQHGLALIFCDLHCIRDAVRKGNDAILKSLEDATAVTGENMSEVLP